MTDYGALPKAKVMDVPPTIVNATLVDEQSKLNATVTVPLDLPGGYKFYTSYQNKTIEITIPEQGAKKGEVLPIPLNQVVDSKDVVVDHWRDGLCACCTYGIFHPSFCNALCCPSLLMGQIMTRLKLTWSGCPVSSDAWKNTYCIMAMIAVVFIISNFFAVTPDEIVGPDDEMTDDDDSGNIFNLILSIGGLFMLFILCKVRKHIRAKYEIPQNFVCEDFCCSLCCGCCVVSQMARHTTDYRREEASFFSSTGLQVV